MSLVLAALVAYGFSRTVPQDLATPGFPLLLTIHAGCFTAWMLLFVAQPAIIAAGSPALHRTVGWFGAALAAAMVVLGAGAILLALRADTVPPFYPRGLFLVRGTAVLLVFAGLVTASLVRRRRGDWHKRLMLCASIAVIDPGIERALPLATFGAAWPFAADAIVDLLALAGPACDLVTRGRIHPAYLWGIGVVVASQAAVDLLAPSPVAPFLLGLVGAH